MKNGLCKINQIKSRVTHQNQEPHSFKHDVFKHQANFYNVKDCENLTKYVKHMKNFRVKYETKKKQYQMMLTKNLLKYLKNMDSTHQILATPLNEIQRKKELSWYYTNI
ncbi:hypothetical protein RF11_05773 [Thelohanellus kitauei]|uniref:Uncharacterized protein n=1 Tax=Thelohanellus kitauei TaxID=669202 RepID=A0A0C2ICD0_THEKT|nr:hypothetical protein RF11_05773 [Thelohanellus kitauei]